MNRTHRALARTSSILSIGLLTCCLLAAAAVASPTVVRDQGLVIGKDMDLRQVILSEGVVLQVDELTKILSKEGRRITLSQLEVAPTEQGTVLARPDAMIEYEARSSGRTGLPLSAVTIRVLGRIPE